MRRPYICFPPNPSKTTHIIHISCFAVKLLFEPINPRPKEMFANLESQNKTAVKCITVRIVVQKSGLKWNNCRAEMKECDSVGP